MAMEGKTTFRNALFVLFSRFRDMSLEAAFDSVDVALYNLREDPQERNDLKLDHPEIFKKLR